MVDGGERIYKKKSSMYVSLGNHDTNLGMETLLVKLVKNLLSNTIQNIKNDSHCLAITIWSGKATINPSTLMLKEISMNIHLVDALEQIPCYKKFMKDLAMKKQTVSFEPTGNITHYNVVASRSFIKKNEDPRAFTIIYIIGSLNFIHII